MGEEYKNGPPEEIKHRKWSILKIIDLIAIIVGSISLLFLAKMCASFHSYDDDRWDTIEHSIKTDPYYKQW